MSHRHITISLGFAVLLILCGAATALAQPAAPADDPRGDIDEAVAAALFERGKELYTEGHYADAKMLFVESLERSPKGQSATQALDMLRNANERLGIGDLEAGAPSAATASGADAPMDPYGGGGDEPVDPYGGGGDEPVDPYGDSEKDTGLRDPYAADDETLDPYAGSGGQDSVDDDRTGARRALMFWGGGYGLLTGLAIAGPTGDGGEVGGGAVLGGLLGAGAGLGLSWYAAEKLPELTAGQAQAVGYAGLWGSYTGGLFGDVVTGVDTSTTNEIYRSMAIGGAIGTGAGILVARNWEPSRDDVTLTNSLGLIGTGSGLLLGAVMDPPTGEAYSINGLLGAGAGLGLGMVLSSRVDVSSARMLRVDLGAAGGVAASWLLFYPLIRTDASNNDEQAAGVVSLLAMAGGAYAAWRLTDDMDADDSPGAASEEPPPVPSLVQRTADGDWSLGAPLPRPAGDSALADPRPGERSFAVDLLGGRF